MDYVEHNEGVTVTEVPSRVGASLRPARRGHRTVGGAADRVWNLLEGLVDVDRLDVEELESGPGPSRRRDSLPVATNDHDQPPLDEYRRPGRRSG